MEVFIINDFMPARGQTFDVVTYGLHLANFDTILGLDLGGGLMLEPEYLAAGLRLTVVQAPATTASGGSGGGYHLNN